MSARQLGDKARNIVRQLNAWNELDMEAAAALYAAARKQDWEAVLDIADDLRSRNQKAWETGIYLAADDLALADEVVMQELAKKRLQAQQKREDTK